MQQQNSSSQNRCSDLKTGVLAVAMLHALYLIDAPVKAEGHQEFTNAYGVNRVVRTADNGYVEVEGTFAVTSTLPSRANGNVLLHDNRPNPYLGGRVGGIEFDGGLLWQPEAAPVGGIVYDPGWSAFIRDGASTHQTSPRIWIDGRSQPWRFVTGSTPLSANITSLLRFTFREDRRVSLQVDAIRHGATFAHARGIIEATAAQPLAPSIAQGLQLIADAVHLDTANMKRVVAMTRAGGPTTDRVGYNDELDGAEMRTTFTGGLLLLRSRRQNGELSLPWVATDVNQDDTGYDAVGDDAVGDDAAHLRAWDRVVQRGRRFFLSRARTGTITSLRVVEFPVIGAVGRRRGTESWTARENGDSRYSRETVGINLRAAGLPQRRPRP